MDYFDGAKILLVEDDEDLSYIMKLQLENSGFECDPAKNLAEINECLDTTIYDLVILDMMLPDTDGISVCKKIRVNSSCPILFVSCVVERNAIIEALSAGGDDYIVKPIDIELLVARIKANLRRSPNFTKKDRCVELKRIILDEGRHTVWRRNDDGTKGEVISLSPIEYKIMALFISKQDQLLLYDELYRCIWESDDLGDVRTVMVHVSNLRKKLDCGGEEMIHTVRGAGYIFSDE